MDSIKPRKSLVEQTYEILLNAICTGELGPGERLTQDEIAAKLNVSRQPVNSAISILKANQLVADTGRRGVIVTPIDRDLFQSIYEFRSVIEPFAVRLAGMRLPESAKNHAGAILESGNAAVRSGDVGAMLQADIDFHEMIFRWSGNPVIENSMRINWHHIRRSMAVVLKDPDAALPVWKDHADIVDHLLAGDTEGATAFMHNHIEKAHSRSRTALEALEPSE
ncbi:GntR family transcriptional regulator [Roseibium marinum]|nr:GntR family transcriptional regulator [Roseibium marinum]